jgi:valyl-tRNA synthetase
MIIAGYEFKGEMPFKQVYFTGMVRDNLRRKMSKSLGNSPDLLNLIERYGADGVRFGILACSPAGGDLIFDAPIDPKTKLVKDESALCEQGRNFCNKLWNALRLIKGWEVVEGKDENNATAIEWFDNALQEFLVKYHGNFNQYRFSELIVDLYSFAWDDFCAWYLEMIKPEFGQSIDRHTLEKTIGFFEQIVALLHPFMPFITEEIWHELGDRGDMDCLIVAPIPHAESFNAEIIAQGAKSKEVITAIREIRAKDGLKNKDMVKTYYQTHDASAYARFAFQIKKLSNSEVFEAMSGESNAAGFVIRGDKFIVETGVAIDTEAEKERINKELEYIKGFIQSVNNKLSNEKFVAGAPPQVIDNERKKLADGEAKLKALMEALQGLGA